ncbi:MAG: glutathione S-transferase family protein [Gammaproteobacteria bacterium]
MSGLILHHYDFSNFSEKIRLIFGLKELSWLSVEIPSHLPKPDYTPLTGGYRRTPALQIGADIYCDTTLIARELETRFPEPSLYGDQNQTLHQATSECLATWAEGPLLWPAALYVTGLHADRFPPSFHSDRAKLHHKPQPTMEEVRTAGLKYFDEMCIQLGRIESLLSHEDDFLLGSKPTLADFTVYGAPWLFETIGGKSPVIDALPRTRKWLAKVAECGHGSYQSLRPREAIDIANKQTPANTANDSKPPDGFQLGQQVKVSPRDEYSPASGKLVAVDEQSIVLRVDNDTVDNIHVHFPRVGYRISRSKP